MKNNYKKIFKESKDEKIFGFKRENDDNSIKFYLPNMLFEGVKNENVLKRLRSYIKLLIKYKKEENKEKNSFKKSKFNNNELQKENNLLSYLFLIEDYENNPEFLIFKKINSKNSKNIDWKKTIDKNDLFFVNKKPIYNTFFSKTKTKDIEQEFFQLYQDTLNNAFDLFFGYKIFKNRKKRKYSKGYRKEQSIINNFLHNNFKDRDIQIAKRLQDIYNSRSESILSDKDFSLFDNTEEINMVWEHMIHQIIKLTDEENKIAKKHLKKGVFKLTNSAKKSGLFIENDIKKEGLAIEIDHIKIDEDTKKIFILDSKFYSTYNNMKKNCTHEDEDDNKKETCSQCLQNILKDFNSPSINKQETYKRIIQKMEEYKYFNIKNFFIMPKTDKFDSNPIHFADHVLISNIEDETNTKNEDYLIHCIALDFNEVVNLYLENKEYTSFLDLLKEIN